MGRRSRSLVAVARIAAWFGAVAPGFGATLVDAGLVWPTPNPAFQQGRPIDAFVQPTATGIPESGLFGCVRNGGSRFHEGLDLFPLERDRRGEAADKVFAALGGRVAYVNRVAGHSSYGRYLVLVHERASLPVYTLYAHLASVRSDLSEGTRVTAGTPLGRMGRSAAGYTIPRSRAHLHFEIGFRLSDNFQEWYDRRKFGSANRHGNWNGMNLLGMDPLAFYADVRSGEAGSLREFVRNLPVVARIRVRAATVPDFVRRYPELLTRSPEEGAVAGWDIGFGAHGLPKVWTPLFEGDILGGRAGDIAVMAHDAPRLQEQMCRPVRKAEGQRWSPSNHTLDTLRKLFGFR